MIKQESQTNDETQLNSKKPTITGSQIDCLVGFAVGAIYWEKGWKGGLTHSFYEAA